MARTGTRQDAEDHELIHLVGLADEIALRLETDILEGKFKPNVHLLQDDLCKRFRVSRTPVREALRKLQARHLVVLVPNKGAMVRVPTQVELAENYVVRAGMEGYACELAAPRMDDEALARMDRAQAVIAAAHARLEATEPEAADEVAALNREIAAANADFHAVIRDVADNARLAELCVSLQSYFPRDHAWRATLFEHEARELNIDEHDAIRAGLAAGDGAAARAAMITHIRHSGRLIVSYLAEQGFWDGTADSR